MRFPHALFDSPVSVVLSCVILAVLNVPSQAIKCFRCSSHDSDKCTKDSAPEPAVPVTECQKDPYNLVKDTIFSLDLKKYGLGEINLETALKTADEKGMDAAELKDMVFCAYIYASSENKVSEGVDKAVSSVAKVFDDGHKEGSTIMRWIVRDCVLLKLREQDKKQFDQCIPLQEKSVFKFYICTCMEDSCNEGPEKSKLMKQLISDANVHDSADMIGKVNLYTFVTILAMQILVFQL